MVLGGVGAEFGTVIGNFYYYRADKLNMAAPRPQRAPVSPAQRPTAVKSTESIPAPKTPAKIERPIQRLENSNHPRFGNDWRYYVNLVVTDYHNRQTWKNALRLAKAWSHFMQAALGVGKLPHLRLDILPERLTDNDLNVAEGSPDSSKPTS